MEYIFEFILELIFESSVELSQSSKVPKYIRYPLIGFVVLFFIIVIGLIFWTGFLSLKENIILGIFFFAIGLLLLIMSVIKFRKTYLNKINKEKLKMI